MKVTDQQVQQMFMVLHDSLKVSTEHDGRYFGFAKELRLQLYQQIMTQQGAVIREQGQGGDGDGEGDGVAVPLIDERTKILP